MARKPRASGLKAPRTSPTERPITPIFTLWDETPAAQRDVLRGRLYREAFGTEAGRRVLSDLLTASGFFVVSPPADHATLAYREGCRWTAAEILRVLAVPDQVLARAVEQDDLSEIFE